MAMKILHILNQSLPHWQVGYTIRSKYIVDLQKALGFEPVVATRYSPPSVNGACPVEKEYLDGVLYLRDAAQTYNHKVLQRLGKGRPPDFDRLFRYGLKRQFRNHISRAIQTQKPDLVHVASPTRNALTAINLGHRYGLPVIYEVRDLRHDSAVANGTIDPASETYQRQCREFVNAMERADHVVTLSGTMKAEFVREGIPEEKISIVPNGVDTSQFQPRERPIHLREKLSILPEEVVIGYIGSLRKLEGIHGLLKAGKILLENNLRVRILVVGEGDELGPLRALARKLNLRNTIHFTGRVPHWDIPDYYALLDLFVIPRIKSKVTDLVPPLKPYEAMCIGKALIVSDVNALREIVDDGKTGLIYTADDPDDLARKCSTLIQDARLRAAMGHRARLWVLEHRAWRKVVARYGVIYKQALRKHRPGLSGAASKPLRKRILFYSQHLVGVGHHFRNLQIVRVLARDHEVHFADGGRPIPGAEVPDSVRRIQLTPIHLTLQGLASENPNRNIEEVLEERQRILRETVSHLRPDVFIIELFPFQRWPLRPELLPAIQTAGSVNPDVRVICSLRDIPLQAKTAALDIFPVPACHPSGDRLRFYSVPFGGKIHEDIGIARRYYEAACPTLNACFDALLIHGDPRVSQLEEHFPWVEDIAIPVIYTGYVSEKPNGALEHRSLFGENPQNRNGFVLVSAGGGVDGYTLAAPCIEAWKSLYEQGAIENRTMVIFSGLFVEETHFKALKQMCGDGPFRLERFAPNFLQWMRAADLSISRSGYNTCMNTLETCVRTLFVPSKLSKDQHIRARKLADLGLAEVIHPDVLTPDRIADAIVRGLSHPLPRHTLALDGAEQTRAFIENL